MVHNRAIALTGLLTAAVFAAGTATSASADTTDAATDGKTACELASQTVAPHATEAATEPSAAEVAAVAQYKARHNSEEAQLRSLGKTGAATARDWKMGLRAGADRVASTACARTAAQPNTATDTVIGGLVHWTQITDWFCGPAVVSEMSGSVPGPSSGHLSQNDAAKFMGTTAAAGTTDEAMKNGLNHFVGQPDFGRDFYAFVWVSDNPTPAERTNFVNNLHTDIGVYSPVAGNVWEVAGGPHLKGHPQNQEIFHYIQIGGYNSDSSQVYYSDSAQNITGWPTVPNFSWFNTSTMVILLGGRGYVW